MSKLHLKRVVRDGRHATLELHGGSARVFVFAKDAKWYLQQPVQFSADGVGLAAAVLGVDKFGAYKVVAVETDETATGRDHLPCGEKSNTVVYVIRNPKH